MRYSLIAETNVLLYGRVEQNWFLADNTDQIAQPVQIQMTHIATINGQLKSLTDCAMSHVPLTQLVSLKLITHGLLLQLMQPIGY